MIIRDDSTLEERLVIILQHFSMKKADLALIADISPQSLSAIMGGKSKNPHYHFFLNISEKLHVNLEWLMSGRGRMLKGNQSESEKQDNEEKYQKIIKDLLYDKLLLEIELGKQDRLTHEASVKEIEFSYTSLVSEM